jgi:hypothetical protein
MDIQKVKATVKKITRLLDQIDTEASAIEKDLVLDYLREAYDLVLESNYPLPKKDSTVDVTATEIKPTTQPQPIVNTPTVPNESNTTTQPQPIINTPTVPNESNTTTQPQPIVNTPTVPNELNTTTQPRPIINTPSVPNELNTTTQPQPIVNTPTVKSSALLQLFQPLTAHDLSEKLGTQPIRSLKQAFSINDRLLFTNELFEKNSDLFADTLKMVDNYESWEPAQSVLLNLATQFQWEKGEKSEIAKQFIKTIQRKFT